MSTPDIRWIQRFDNFKRAFAWEVLARYPEIEKAVLYGSRAIGSHRPGSDIDLTLCGGQLDHTLLSRIENELDDRFLPCRIDLSLFTTQTHPRRDGSLNLIWRLIAVG